MGEYIIYTRNFKTTYWSFIRLIIFNIFTVCFVSQCQSIDATAKVWNVVPEIQAGIKLVQALSGAEAGDTIILGDGEYRSPDRLSTVNSGLPGKPITVKARTPGRAIFLAGNNKFGFYFKDKSYVTIEGLILLGYSRGCGVKIINCHDIQLKSLTVTDSQSQNISVIDSHKIAIEKCISYGSRSTGIYVFPKNENYEAVRDNKIIDNESHHNRGSGILVFGADNMIAGNRSYSNGHKDPLDHGIYCIGKNNLIENNSCWDNAYGSGIRAGGYALTIRNNTCIGNGRSGIVLAGTNPGQNIKIEGNLLQKNRHSGLQINSSKYSPHDVRIVKNIFSGNHDNVTIQKKVSAVSFDENIFSEPIRYQINIGEETEDTVRFKGNRFFGPICNFKLSGKRKTIQEFALKIQPGSECLSQPYSIPDERKFKLKFNED